MKKRILAAVAAAVLLAAFSILASNPMVFCEAELPEGYLAAIESQSKGVYSPSLPLIPVFAAVDGFSEGRVYYTIQYFPFGTIGLSYAAQDGYNIEKPMTGS